MNAIRCLLTLVVSIPIFAWAQADDSGGGATGSGAPFEFGILLGNLLPNQVNGVTEIMGLGGARMGFRSGPQSYIEAGAETGNGSGQQWKNGNLGIRMDIPVQNLVGIAGVGADATYFKGMGHSSSLIFGGHVLGGMMTHLGGSAWLRADMQFSFSPGTTLFIDIGLMWRLGGGK